MVASEANMEGVIESWSRELLELSARDGVAGYPLEDAGGGWIFGTADDIRAAWYPALLWEVSALTGASELAVAAKAYAERALDFAVDDGSPGPLPMQAGQGEGLSRWVEMDWQERPPEAAERFLTTMEGRWMPEPGAFWHTAIARPRSPDGLSGGWAGRDNTSLESLVEMAGLWEVAAGAGVPEWQERARRHVAWVLQQHLRPDGGSVERVVYDGRATAAAESAYSGESTLARSHAMGMLGLVRWARLTGERGPLEAVDRMYRYMRHRMPGPLPPWDLEAAHLPKDELAERFGVDPGSVESGATDSGAAAVLALALAEAVPLVVEGRGWEYFATAGRLVAAVEAAGSGVAAWGGSRSLLSAVHAAWPGQHRGDIVADYAYIRAKRLLRSLGEPRARWAEALVLPADATLRVTEAQPWRVGADAGALALRYQAIPGEDDGAARFGLLEGRSWQDFAMSLLLWPDRSASLAEAEAVLVFGYEGPGDHFLVTLGRGAGSIRLERVLEGRRSLLAESAGGLPEEPAFNELRVEVLAGWFILEVGGNERMRVPLESGAVAGMVGFGATGPFWFDDIAVSGNYSPVDSLPRGAWREATFADPFGVAAWDDSDPDGDGRSNLLEYVMGSDPLDGNHSGKHLSVVPADGLLHLAFPVDARRSDATVTLQGSIDGGRTWDAVPDERVPTATDWQTATARVSPLATGARLFRLNVSRIPVE